MAKALRDKGYAIRAVSRASARLERTFPDPGIEKIAANLLQADETRRAIESADIVFDCLGLPSDQMHLHPVAARHVADAVRAAKVRCVQVSSFWAYLPLRRSPLNEDHPREDGSAWMRYRREAEDILLAAGAAILHLPDFYGPHVHTSTLQNALTEAVRGKTINWLGGKEIAREYIFVPDAMRIAAAISERREAFGSRWILPGAGPLTGRRVAEIASQELKRPVKLRSAGLALLRILSLFSKDLRGLMQIAPDYMKPIAYDATKLVGLLGPQEITPYDKGIALTIGWITAARAHD